ncbi:cytochrome P450 [Xylona heveae TC161]|uniref:Cytochrome P450 n=1 Tax=Xylona heveae (strain CBS 132557 / TC161) TaxID=1328760 RepID=A0A165K3D5_XYLHT|nr:cytochrome P450 [Xylona heveae TC161]KZF26941.1 cytochrome P450 [Xylona heveae TC161]
MQVPITITGLLWLATSFAVYILISTFLTSRRNATKARQLNCEEPPFEKNKCPIGIDNLLRALAADRAQQFPVDLIERFEALGTYTYRYQILGARNVRTADPKNIQAILANQFSDFDVGPRRRGNFLPLVGDGIFTADGKHWKHSRAMMRPQFTRDQISDLNLEETHVQNMMRLLEPLIEADGWTKEVDLLPYFFRLTIDSATEFLFGESVNSQLRLLPGYQSTKMGSSEAKFAKALDDGQRALATRARFMDRWWLYDSMEFRGACKIVHEFVDHFVRLALSKDLRKKDLEKGSGGKEQYIFLEALAAETQDPTELRSELLHVLLAGRDTTASHLGWVFHSLAHNPECYKKLRDSIVADFGTCDRPKEITFSKLKDCKYLRYVNDESLRLYPVVPINGRCANKDTTLPRGGGKDGNSPVFVPKGSMVDYSVHVMHRRKDIWGPDADEFKPERWEGRKVGWEYLPFNGGPRICIGQQFALTEASYVTVRLLQRFDTMESVDKDEVVRHNLTLINRIANGVKVRLHAM